jgi:outer membrane lipase/esterase
MHAPLITRQITRLMAAATLAVASTGALAYSNVFIFGDSLSDSGNNGLALGVPNGVPQAITSDFFIPSLPFAPFGTYSNGPVWATPFAAGLGLSATPSLAGGSNFAFGGARTLANGTGPGGFPFSATTQVGQFLGATGGIAPSNALYVVAIGGNDARDALESLGPNPSLPQIVGTISAASNQFAINVGNIVDTLQAAGAQNIIVWNAPNLGTAPAVVGQGAGAIGLATLLAQSMNDALDYRLSFETGVFTFDVFGLVGQVVANPGAYGLSNVTNACVTGICMDPSTYLFWDGIHPSAAGHQLIAGEMLQLAQAIPEPGTWLLMALGLVGLVGWKRRQG